MKALFLSVAIAAALAGQNATTDRPTPGSTATSPGASGPMAPTLGAPAIPATPAAPVSPDAVVAKVGGKAYTAAEMDKMLQDLPPQIQAAIARQPQLLNNMFLVRSLAQQAEFENLDKNPQVRQQLEYQRLNTLAQAEVNNFRNSMKIDATKEKTWYEQNKDQYRVAKVKAIFISFGAPKIPPPDAKAPAAGRTEEQAKTKIEDLRKQIDGGADFSKLATEQSDDKASAAKGGDYGEITMSTGSEKAKIAVFKLKPGEVSEPVREPGGFYLFKLEDISFQPFEKVQGLIRTQLQQSDFQAWLKGIEARNKVTIENPGWFAARNTR